jgi:mannosyltransferase OCH1-like enzyme
MPWILSPQIIAQVNDNRNLLPKNFDYQTYIDLNPDLSAAGIDDEIKAIHHFLLFGKNENRLFFRHPIKINQHEIKPKDIQAAHEPSNINKKILIKIPTLGRPEQLLSSIESFSNSAHNEKNIYFIITIDKNDSLSNNSKILNQLKKYKNLIVCKEDTSSKIDAYNLNIDLINFDILILSSDDMIVTQQGYDQIIIDNMHKYFPKLDGVLWFDTGDKNLRTNTLAIIGKSLYDEIKPIYKYCYTGYYCDDEFSQIAFKLGKMVRVNQQIIKHNIPDHLDMSNDTTYLKSLSYGSKDRTIYKIRKKIQFDIPGVEPLPSYHNIPKEFMVAKRNKNWPNFWLAPEAKYDDPISSMDLYAIEEMDKTVTKMDKTEFTCFAKNYFRDFRWTIPPVIHQIWVGGPIPAPIKEMMETFSIDYIKQYPGFRYILWDDAKLKNLKMINRDLFDKETKYDCKSDIARVEILNQFGGIFIDSDTIWLGNKSLLSIQHLISYGILIAYEKIGKKIGKGYLNENTTRCANGVFGATIQNPIMAYLIGQMRISYENNRKHGVVAATGPDFVQSVFDSLQSDISVKILDHKYFYPSWWCVNKQNNPEYHKFVKDSSLSKEGLIKKYPEAILFHKGWTSAKNTDWAPAKESIGK